eukprot:13646866-Heterocapsa_arctica.AAC.1
MGVLYGQQSCITGQFLACIEHARNTEIADISREVTEAADRMWASGGRILEYIPKDRPLSNHIYAFTVASMRLDDQYEDIIAEREPYSTFNRMHPWLVCTHIKSHPHDTGPPPAASGQLRRQNPVPLDL